MPRFNGREYTPHSAVQYLIDRGWSVCTDGEPPELTRWAMRDQVGQFTWLEAVVVDMVMQAKTEPAPGYWQKFAQPPVTPQEEEVMRELARPDGPIQEIRPSLASIQYDLRSLDEAQLRAVIESCRVQLAVRGVREAQSA